VETASTWEIILAGVVALLVILWFRPGIKAAPKDWPSVLIPLAVVVLFVLLLIALV
jgi:hypothetical protein